MAHLYGPAWGFHEKGETRPNMFEKGPGVSRARVGDRSKLKVGRGGKDEGKFRGRGEEGNN